MTNASLRTSNFKIDNDEYYTYYKDIESEVEHYTDQLKGKTIYCNCDNPYKSQFVKYFLDNFERLGINRLIATSKEKENEHGLYLDINSPKYHDCVSELNGDGSFYSDECLNLLKECDIVITNPPFSLFRKWYSTVRGMGKEILAIGNLNAILYKEVIADTVSGRLRCGYTARNGHSFWTDSGEIKKLGFSCWMTTLEIKENPFMTLSEGREYRHYDTYPDAIEVPRIAQIPSDYHGLMGVPITFWIRYNRNQFRIVGKADQNKSVYYNLFYPTIDGVDLYKRLVIERI